MYTVGDGCEILEIFYARKTFEIEVFEFCSTRLATFEVKKKSLTMERFLKFETELWLT